MGEESSTVHATASGDEDGESTNNVNNKTGERVDDSGEYSAIDLEYKHVVAAMEVQILTIATGNTIEWRTAGRGFVLLPSAMEHVSTDLFDDKNNSTNDDNVKERGAEGREGEGGTDTAGAASVGGAAGAAGAAAGGVAATAMTTAIVSIGSDNNRDASVNSGASGGSDANDVNDVNGASAGKGKGVRQFVTEPPRADAARDYLKQVVGKLLNTGRIEEAARVCRHYRYTSVDLELVLAALAGKKRGILGERGT
jgi:hypothetical protein